MDLSAIIHLLGDTLGEVISELESPAVFEAEERIRGLAKARRQEDHEAAHALQEVVSALHLDQARAVASAFALYFDLVNLAEEESRVSILRERVATQHPAPIAESIGAAIATMHERGVTPEEMTELLGELTIELVLTAHPTEATRRTILSKLQRITEQARAISTQRLLPDEEEACRATLKAEISSIWLTNRARAVRPTVTDEVRTGLYFVDNVFWEVLPRIYSDLERALARLYPGVELQRPWLQMASWIGGDRDGNPNVTPEVTAETLRLHRGLAIEHHRRSIGELSRRLSVSGKRVPPPPELTEWLAGRRPYPTHAAYIETRYDDEPYRLALSLLAADLADASAEDMPARLMSDEPHSARVGVEDIMRPLSFMTGTLPAAIVHERIGLVQRQLAIFGLHSARLDMREHSANLASALAETLRALNIEPESPGILHNFAEADRAARKALLVELLAGPEPELASQVGVTLGAANTWALFRLIGRVRCVYGPDLLGPFIISMTRDAADVLTALLLAQWSGCAGGLQIAPLFETRADLAAAPGILAELFSIPLYREHLRQAGNEQIVMVGYSDSNKDSGYLAANWALYQAQEDIVRVCRDHGVKCTLFHGRGGTVARGGGPANRAIRAQPPGTVNGRMRLTEQGEIIAARYANRDLAHRHLEQIVHAVLLRSIPERHGDHDEVRPAWRTAMDTLAVRAWEVYRVMVYETPDFLTFWQAATPIDEIMRLHIGSRPATRKRGELSVEDVRAIPWVFSWMQSRFNLPGWYGLGSALQNGVALSLLQEMYAGWPFFRAAIDNAEMALVKADMGIAQLYVSLVPDRALADRLFGQIRAEYNRTTEALLATTGHRQLLAADPVIQRSVQLRNPYIDPLNYIQVDALRQLRGLKDQEGAQASNLRQVVVLTINGIAGGLRNTG